MSKWATLDPELLDIYQAAEDVIFKTNRELKMLAMRAQMNQNMDLCKSLKQLTLAVNDAFESIVFNATMTEYEKMAQDENSFDPDKRVLPNN